MKTFNIEIEKAKFWSRVEVRGESECWPWKAGSDRYGYGRFPNVFKTAISSRIAWSFFNGAFPEDGMQVCHRCDNPPCCNPNHLFLGTKSDNMKDAYIKGRLGAPGLGRTGERHSMHKLTWVEIDRIRIGDLSHLKCPDVSKILGVNKDTVGKIRRYRTWKPETRPTNVIV